MKTIETLKKAATRVEDYLAAAGIHLKHTMALEVVARVEGVKSWNVLERQALHTGADESPSNREVLDQILQEANTAALGAPGGDFCPRTAAVLQSLKRLEGRVVDSTPCISVEYDPSFFGGDYRNVGNTVAVPLNLVDLADGSVERAFEVLTGVPSRHIVFYTLDEVVSPEGNPSVPTSR